MNVKLKKARDKAVEDYNSRLEEIQDMLDQVLESEKGKGAKTEQSVDNILKHFSTHVTELKQNAKAFAGNHKEWNPSPEVLRGQGTPGPGSSQPDPPARMGASSTFSQEDPYTGQRESLQTKGSSQG